MNYKEYLKSTEKRNLKMWELKVKGWSYKRIGEKYGITRQRVEQIVKAAKEKKQLLTESK